MTTKTFKELNNEASIRKRIVKVGLSLGLVFSKEEIERFKLKYHDEIFLDNAEIQK